jgi:hypothetical protein
MLACVGSLSLQISNVSHPTKLGYCLSAASRVFAPLRRLRKYPRDFFIAFLEFEVPALATRQAMKAKAISQCHMSHVTCYMIPYSMLFKKLVLVLVLVLAIWGAAVVQLSIDRHLQSRTGGTANN